MSINHRLAAPYGLLIDRSKPVSFSFEGQVIEAYQGDTIASALVANGDWLMSRSFKYHRPRGPLTMAGQDANTLIHVPSEPNTLADKREVKEGLEAKGQNYVGSLHRDLQAYTGLLSRFLPVGFYYKAFFRPKGMWEIWAPFFRKQAGLGVIDQSLEPAYKDKQYKFADVTVIGAGPAGMSAAIAAAKQGVQVLLVDENPVIGGSLNYAHASAENVDLRSSLVEQIENNSNIEVMTSAAANSWHPDNWLALVTDDRLYKLRTKELIVCSGSLEQQAIFRGNDIPGVVMSSAAQRLMHLYAVKPGERAVVIAGNNQAYETTLDLVSAGVEVTAVVDMRSTPCKTLECDRVAELGIRVIPSSTVYEAFADSSTKRVKAVEVRSILSQGECSESRERIECDIVCMSVGYMPTYQLVCQAGGQLSYDDETCLFSLHSYPKEIHLAGSVNGGWELGNVVKEGDYRGTVAANSALGLDLPPELQFDDEASKKINHPWPMFAHPKGKEFVDYDEDLQIKDIVNATVDGYEHIQLVKRYSTCGMGPSQGRHSALAAARLVAKATNRTVADTGVTTARPPFASEQLGLNAGRSFFPEQKTNMHYRHIEAGAQMMQAGAWYRPAYYLSAGNESGDQQTKDAQMQQCINREVDNVRNNVGLIDVSTLGGLEVRGPDAAEFLNRFYTFAFAKQEIGKARYALLSNEAGVVIDDGVACRFHHEHFYVTATTGGVGRVFQSMLKWNAQWGLDVDIANATTAWCGVNIAGPNARAVLSKVCSDIDLSNDAFPYMGVREGTVAEIPARLIRVGFVGELGYEIHVPQQYGEALWDALMLAGRDHQILPFGVEAQRVLRLEKGHVIIGQDTDAMSNPMEVQMSWAIARKKPFFVGARTIRELEEKELSRVLVGFTLPKGSAVTPKESHLVLNGSNMVGRVTSSNYSQTLGQPIGLAYVPPTSAAANSQITIKCDGGVLVQATVVSLPFYDPENARQGVKS
jgi:sarcosine oxidase subunit alpha